MLFLLIFNLISLSHASDAQIDPNLVNNRGVPFSGPSKKTVCTFTINSSDETKAFQEKLGNENFNFVEMVPQAPIDGLDPESESWFEGACSSNTKCDIVIISGHFGGTFFGSSGQHLSLETMKKKACSQTCKGIFNAPKEVFLFGCNTLATKEADSRTPEQYRRVLIADGFTIDRANDLTASRYSDVGFDNQSSMRSLFAGVPHIYGFSSIAPSGPHIYSMLSSYLNKSGNYSSYIDTVQRLPGIKNTRIAEALRTTHFSEMSGGEENSELLRFSCSMYDSKRSLDSKVSQARSVLSSNERFSYLPAIESFVRENQNKNLVVQFRDEIHSMVDVKSLILKLLIKSSSLGVNYTLFKIDRTFRLTSNNEFNSRFTTEFLKPALSLPLSVEHVDLLRSIDFSRYAEINIDDSELITKEHFEDPKFSGVIDMYIDSKERGISFEGDKATDTAFAIIQNWRSSTTVSIANAIKFLKYRNKMCDTEKEYPRLNEALGRVIDETNSLSVAMAVIGGKQFDALPTTKLQIEKIANLLPADPSKINVSDDVMHWGLVYTFYRYGRSWQKTMGSVDRLNDVRDNYMNYFKLHPEFLKNRQVSHLYQFLKSYSAD